MKKIKYRIEPITEEIGESSFIIERRYHFKWDRSKIFRHCMYSSISLAIEDIKRIHKNEQVMLSIKARWTEEK